MALRNAQVAMQAFEVESGFEARLYGVCVVPEVGIEPTLPVKVTRF